MVLLKLEFQIKEERTEDYYKFDEEELTPFCLSAQGLSGFNDYRDHLTCKRLVPIGFKDFESIGKILDYHYNLEEMLKKSINNSVNNNINTCRMNATKKTTIYEKI